MSAKNPYVGPRAFTTGEALFGRTGERAALLDLLVAERVVVLHAPSGAGKSSLLLAGLVPDLRAEGFVVRPPIRVGTEPPAGAGGVNRFSQSAVLSLEEGAAQPRPLAELRGSSLAQYLGEAPAEAEVLIFDQFEEVLTIEPVDRASKQAFFADLAAALRCPQRWVVIAIREDHLAGLAPYQRALPTRLKTTFHLDLLGVEAALEAVQRPARAAGVEFTDAAARKLVDDLRQVQVQTADGGTGHVAGPHVEPVQLQVACRDLWERKAADDRVIDERDVQEIGDVDHALTRYYDAQIAAVAEQTATAESELRRWFDRALISEQGLRGQALQGATQTEGLANTVVRRLVDTHLLRAEQRRGIVWFELAHDRLLAPVRASNIRWSAEHLSATERQALLWDSHGRPEALLLTDLVVIERELAAPGTAALERSFLEHSRLLRRREAEASRLRRTVRWLAAAAAVAVLATLVALVVVFRLRSKAEAERRQDAEAQRDREKAATVAARQQGREALSRQLSATVLLTPPERADVAALYAVAASQIGTGWDLRACLSNLMARAPNLRAVVPGKMMPMQLAHDPGAGVLAGLEFSGRMSLWDLKTRALIAGVQAGVGHEAVVFDASRGQFVTADRDATVTFYEPATGQGRSLSLETGPWRRVAVSGDGARLATADAFGKVGVWDASTGAKLGLAVQPQWQEERAIEVLALDPSGVVVALATQAGEVRVWRWPGGDFVPAVVPAAEEGADRGPPAGLRFTAAGALVGLLGDGRVLRWDMSTEGVPGEPTQLAAFGLDAVAQAYGQRTKFLGLGLAGDGASAAAVLCLDACTREVLLHWDGASGQVASVAIELPDRDHEERRFDLQVTPEVAIGTGTRVAARVWDLQSWRPLPGSPTQIGALAVSGDDMLVAAGGCPEGLAECATSEVVVWRAVDRSRVHQRLRGLDEATAGLAFFAGDRRLAGIGRDGAAVLWDMSSGQVSAAERLPVWPDVLALRARGDGLVAALGKGASVYLWDVLAGSYVPVNFRGPELPVSAVAIDASATRVAAGGCWRARAEVMERGGTPRYLRGEAIECERGAIYLWDAASGAAIGGPTEAHGDAVIDLNFSSDGATLVSVGADGVALLFATEGGLHDERGLEEATGAAQAASFSRDGQALATIGGVDDGLLTAEVELRLWAGEPLAAVGAATRKHSPLPREGVHRPRRVVFAAGTRALLSGSVDGVVLRDVSVPGMHRRACTLAGRDMTAEEWRRFLPDEPPPSPSCGEVLRPDLALAEWGDAVEAPAPGRKLRPDGRPQGRAGRPHADRDR